MSVWPVPENEPVVIRRVLDDGRRNPPALTVTAGALFDFHTIPSYDEPDGAPRLAAKIRKTIQRWTHAGAAGTTSEHEDVSPEWIQGEEEVVIIDQGLNSSRLLAALGHRTAGHACQDCEEAS